MRIIISGGGTGGHIYPAITIARALENECQCDVLFVGTKHGLEADIVPKEGYRLKTIDVKGLERKFTFRNVYTIAKSAYSIWQSSRIIRDFKPDIVVGTGGYVCGPVLLAAAFHRIPTLIQEQNVIAGITNKILARFVDKVAVGYEEAAKYFSAEKIIVSGNPIRSSIMTATHSRAVKELGLTAGKKTILISGGSRGARSINTAMLEVHKYYAGKSDVQLLHITGQSEYNDIVGKLSQSGIDIINAGNIIIKPYIYDMPLALAVAELAVFRAGAIGLAELTARGIPAILIPYPFAAENHQEYNARVLEQHGAAIVIKDSDLNGTKLLSTIESILHDSNRLDNMAIASKSLGKPEAARNIALEVIKLATISINKT